MVIFGEGGIEDLVGGLDAPALAYDQQPVVLGESRFGEAGDYGTRSPQR
jgi:hypothetical protein